MTMAMTIRDIVAEALEIDASEVTDDFVFVDHPAWDSLAALTMITALEDYFKVVLSGSDLRDAQTVAGLAARVGVHA